MSGPSGGQNTVVQNSEPPQQFLQAYQDVVNRAQGVANTPYTPYPGQLVAGLDPLQQQGIGAIQSEQGQSQPYIGAASNYFNNATAPLWSGLPQFSSDAISQYLSPYTKNVVDSTQAEFNNQNAQAKQRLQGQEVQQGAWGNDRNGIAAAELANQEQLAQAPVIAGLNNTGYNTALGEFNTEQQAELGANEANRWLDSQAAFGTAALGQDLQTLNANDVNGLLGAGGLRQSVSQEQLNVPYQQYLAEQAYPFQTTQFLSGITGGMGSLSGGTGNSTSTSTPSLSSQAFGGLESGIGLAGATGGFGSSGWLTGGSGLLASLFGSGAGADAFAEVGADAMAAAMLKRGGGISDYVNDNEYPRTQRATGTHGIGAYDGGGDIEDEEDMSAPPGSYTDDAPQAPGGDGISMAANRYAPNYTPPSADSPEASNIRSMAPWLALTEAGFSTLGSGNIGEGASKGMQLYESQNKQAEALEEKAKEAHDSGTYRFADLTQQGQRLSDAADEAASRLKQGDEHFAATQAGEGADRNERIRHDKADEAHQRDALDQGHYTAQAGEGPDPVTGASVPGVYVFDTKNGTSEFRAGATITKGGGASSMSGREAVFTQRVLNAASEGAESAKNIMELPITTSRGLFGGRSQGPGLFDALKEDAANVATDSDARRYNVMLSGLTRNLGAIETSGLAVPGSLTHNLGSVVIQPGDDVATRLSKMAEIRQIVDFGMDPMLHNPRLPDEQKKYVQGIKDKIDAAIPFTQHDVTAWSTKGKSGQTFGDFVKQNRVAGGGTQGPSQDAIAHLVANPALAKDFDAKYGPGAAEKYLPAPRP